jgi:hypothetical protein
VPVFIVDVEDGYCDAYVIVEAESIEAAKARMDAWVKEQPRSRSYGPPEEIQLGGFVYLHRD